MLTPGEVVISKPAVQKFGGSNLLAINVVPERRAYQKLNVVEYLLIGYGCA